MNVSSSLIFFIKMILLTLVFIGCSIISEKLKAESIMILLGEHNLTGCQWLGEARGSSEGIGDDASYPERLLAARNNLRNETSRLGGNSVLIRHANNTGRYEIPGIDKTIVFVGHAYLCP